MTIGELQGEGIEYVDALPALQAAVDQHLYAETTADMHPGRNGYRIIAAVAEEYLRTHKSRE